MVVIIVHVAVVHVEAVPRIEATALAKAVVITDVAIDAVRIGGSCKHDRGRQRRGGCSWFYLLLRPQGGGGR
jgi:hypothetical protein